MTFLIPLIIVVEIIGSIILTSPAKKQLQSKANGQYKNVLGEEDNTSSENTPTSAPQEPAQGESNPTSDPQANPQPTAQTAESISAEPQPTQAPSVTETSSNPSETTPNPSAVTPSENQTTAPSETTAPIREETPQETQTPNMSVTVTETSSESSSPSPKQAEIESETDQQKTTVNELNNDIENKESNLYNNMDEKSAAESVSKENKEELDGENNQVEQAKTPLDKAQLLVQFGDKDVQHMNVEAQNNNLDEVVFHAEKFTYQLDKALDTIQTLPPEQAEKVKENVTTLCKNADTALRQQELVVGEVDAQSLETARGTCFDYTYGP